MKKLYLILFNLVYFNCLFSQTTIADSIKSNGIYRSFRLYIPKNFNDQRPVPLVLNIHGYTSNAQQQQAFGSFMPIADTANFLVVHPQGTKFGKDTYWNAGISPLGAKDVQFLSEMIDYLMSKYKIDRTMIYSTGMSMGGFMSHSLACSLTDKIAAIASVTGSIFTAQYPICKPTRPIPIMQIHGTEDKLVPFKGGNYPGIPDPKMIPVDTVVSYWVRHNKCNPTPIFTKVPDINTTDKTNVEHYLYKDGTNGTTCEFYKVIGGGHSWPGVNYQVSGNINLDFDASNTIWLFFRKYRLINGSSVNMYDQANNVQVYPNPFTDKLNIEGNQIKEVSVYDVAGRLILQTTKNNIDGSNFNKGVYTVIIKQGTNQTQVKKVVKL